MRRQRSTSLVTALVLAVMLPACTAGRRGVGPADPMPTGAVAADRPEDTLLVSAQDGLWAVTGSGERHPIAGGQQAALLARLRDGEAVLYRFRWEDGKVPATVLEAERMASGEPVVSRRLEGRFNPVAATGDREVYLARTVGGSVNDPPERVELWALDPGTGRLRGPARGGWAKGPHAGFGIPWQIAVAPDGRRLYALYLNLGVRRPEGPDAKVFVRPIDLDALAIGPALPLPVRDDLESDEGLMVYSIALSPDGRRLYAASGGLRQLAVIDTAAWNLERTLAWAPAGDTRAARSASVGAGLSVLAEVARRLGLAASVAEAKRALFPGVAMAPDGSALYVVAFREGRPGQLRGDGLWAIDPATGEVCAQWLRGKEVFSVAAGPDGRFVYAVAQDDLTPQAELRLLAVDTRTGRVTDLWPDATARPWRIEAVLP